MPKVALIGGSSPLPGASDWPVVQTQANAYGTPSGPLRSLDASGDCLYLPRHDERLRLAPHAINYRANVQLLLDEGVTHALCSYSVGGIDPALLPGALVVPDQLIDYSWGREHTFHDGEQVEHLEFSAPFDAGIIAALQSTAQAEALSLDVGGVYASVQGPRLETVAEVARLARDGCTLVGMTAMPEIALLRERGIAAAALCLVINPAAGVVPGTVDFAAMQAVADAGAAQMQALLLRTVQRIVSA